MRLKAPSRRSVGTAVMVAVGLCLGGASSAASLCGTESTRIGAKFSEAALLCGPPAGMPAEAARAEPAATASDAIAYPDRVSIIFGVAAPRPTEPVVARRIAARPKPALHGLVVRTARAYRIDPHLLASVVHRESRGRLDAVSHKGALGLMQVMPATARSLGVDDPARVLVDPELALATGARYLKQLQARFGNDVPIVLAAYNAGPGAVRKAGGIPAYRETQGYVAAVMHHYRQLLQAAR